MTADDPTLHQSEPAQEAKAEVIIEAPLAFEQAVQRSSFRLPQDDEYPLRLYIESEQYEIVNSSVSGLAFLPATEDQFHVGQEIADLKLAFLNTSIHVRGSVVHISRLDLEQSVLGVKLFFQDEGEHQQYKEYLAFIRERLVRSRKDSP